MTDQHFKTFNDYYARNMALSKRIDALRGKVSFGTLWREGSNKMIALAVKMPSVPSEQDLHNANKVLDEIERFVVSHGG